MQLTRYHARYLQAPEETAFPKPEAGFPCGSGRSPACIGHLRPLQQHGDTSGEALGHPRHIPAPSSEEGEP